MSRLKVKYIGTKKVKIIQFWSPVIEIHGCSVITKKHEMIIFNFETIGIPDYNELENKKSKLFI